MKTGIVVPILKPGEDPGNVASYRLITLLSCFGKVMKQIIKNSLEYVVEIKKLLKPEQYGFRKGQGTTDILVRLEHRIQKTLENRNISMVVYLDLRSAFDMIWGKGLICKLVKSGITGNMIKWLDNYFESRKIQVRLDHHFSCEMDILAGTPQGAVCSPLLFNLMLIDVPKSEYIKQYIHMLMILQ